MPSFFMKNAQKGKKRKPITKPSIKPKNKANDKIESDDDDESIPSGKEDGGDESESDHETAQAKRLRLAKEYIQQLEEKERDKQDDKDIDHDAIAHRLRQDVLEEAGQLQKFIADQIKPDENNIKHLRGHKLTITCVILSSDNKYIFSASKDGSIIKWDMCSCQKLCKLDGISKNSKDTTDKKGHTGQILALALSTDFKYLASAGQDTLINIWDPSTFSWIHTFKGHRNIVTGLVFQHKQHQLYSASHDKSIKVWNLNEMAYVETLFGHEDAVLGIDSLLRDRVVSCGGRDRSVRLWKIPEESQLVFQSSSIASSFDCVTMLNEDYFLTGGDDGSLSIFFVRKKKPVTLRTKAHIKTEHSPSGSCDESWISAVAALPYTDLVASGSCDGCIRLWRCEKSFRAIMPIHTIKVNGFVNDLKFSSDGDYLVAGIGQEHRLGRWWKMKNIKNTIMIIPLVKNIIENT